MEPKKIYSIQWTQAYPQFDLSTALRNLLDELVELSIAEGDCLEEAQAVIAKAMQR